MYVSELGKQKYYYGSQEVYQQFNKQLPKL